MVAAKSQIYFRMRIIYLDMEYVLCNQPSDYIYLQRNSEILLSIESLHRQLGLLLLFESSEVILNQESGVELPHCHFIF